MFICFDRIKLTTDRNIAFYEKYFPNEECCGDKLLLSTNFLLLLLLFVKAISFLNGSYFPLKLIIHIGIMKKDH